MAKPHSAETLVARAQKGDRVAFDRLATRFRGQLLDSVRARLPAGHGIVDDPDDVVNETLLRAFEGIDRFEWQGEDSFLRWLFGIARNVQRHGFRQKRSLLSMDAAREAVSQEPSPSRALGREERFSRLQAAISHLPPNYREVIQLSRIDGLKTKEVAERLGRSTDSVKHALARALQLLRRELSDTESLHLPDRRLEQEGGNDGE